MKTHSELGAAIIKDMDFPQDHPLVHTAWEICRWHHERWDGKGYPDGLKGGEKQWMKAEKNQPYYLQVYL